MSWDETNVDSPPIGTGKEADVKVKAQDTKKHDTAILNQCMQVKTSNSHMVMLISS